MSVWLTIPSARPVEEAAPVLEKWRERGYKIALWRDSMDFPYRVADYIRADPYPGYAKAVNSLIADVMCVRDYAEWFIAAGDDTLPDPYHTAEEIALECRQHFGRLHGLLNGATSPRCETFGVMQPTGDRFAQGQIDRIAGSAWIGREFARRAYGGNGPLWHEFTHMWVDEHLKAVAEKLGIYWMRPDLTHLHMHWQRESSAINSNAIHKPDSEKPAHMHPSRNDGYTREHWKKYEALFFKLRADGFAEAYDLLPAQGEYM